MKKLILLSLALAFGTSAFAVGFRPDSSAATVKDDVLTVDSLRQPKEFGWRRYAVNSEGGLLQPDSRYRISFSCKVEGGGDRSHLLVLVRPLSCTDSAKDVMCVRVDPTEGKWRTFSLPVATGAAKDYRLQVHSWNRIRAEIRNVAIVRRPPLAFASARAATRQEAAQSGVGRLPTGAQEFEVDLPRPGNGLVLEGADFGVSVTNADNTVALRAAFAAAKARHAARLTLAPGTYRLTCDAPLALVDFSDFTFDGRGATFVTHRKSGVFMEVRQCVRTRLMNFRLDWDWAAEPLASLVEVVATKEDESFDLRFVDYPVFPNPDAALTILSAWDPKTRSVGVEDGITRGLDMGRAPKDRVKKTWLDGRTVRVSAAPRGLAVGQRYRLQHYYYHMNGFNLISNEHLRLENVDVLSTPGHAFLIGGTQHHTLFSRVNIVVPADDPKRVITCTADHLHVASSRGFIKLENCEFSRGADDIMNMHDNSGFARRRSERVLRAQNAPSFAKVEKGTRIEVRNGDYSPTGFTGTVVDVKPVPDARRTYDITFAEAVPEETKDGFVLFNTTYDTHNVIVRNCNFHDNRARGLLILARDVTVENNVFRHQEMGAIKIETGYTLTHWSEGYGVSNVVIRGNLFDCPNPSGASAGHLQRTIYAGIYLKTDPSQDTTDYPILRDILIEGNTFRDNTGVTCYLSSVSNVIFRGNVIEDPTPRRRNLPFRSQIHLVQANDVRVFDNVYRPSPNVVAPGVTWEPDSCSGIVVDGLRISDASAAQEVPVVDISGEAARQTVVAEGTPETYQGHPTTLLADDGKTMFCVWTTGHGGPCGPMARSDDGGRTWTRLDDQLPSAYKKTHYNCPTLQKIVGPDGKRRYFAFSAKRNPRAALAILMSEDLGCTWKELPCAPHISAGMPPTGFMQLKDGSCALFGQVRTDPNVKTDRPTDDQDVWMSVSKDGGITWGPMRTVAHAKGRNLCEPCCLRSPDGKTLALLMRENRHKGRSMMCFSRDEGATWSPPVDTAWTLTGDRHEGILLPDGRYVICFRDQAIGSATRGQYMAWVGTWDDLVNARPGQCRVHLLKHYPKADGTRRLDTGYSGVELLPDGTVVCTTYSRHFDDERQSSVVSMRFRISEIDAKLKEAASDYAKYVDVFTGTAGTGHTTPAAAVPFGMVQAGPDSGNRNWAYCSGYQYNDQTVIGYSQTHLSGTGCTDMGDVQILPFTGAYSVRPVYRAVDKSQECGEPGYYATVQDLDALKVEITATKHVGCYRITSLAGRPIKVLFDPNAGCSAGWGTVVDRDITCDVSEPGKIRGGYVRSSWVKNRPMFYAIAFSRPWAKIERQERLRSDRQDAYVAEFGADELLVRVALSQTSSEAAVANMAAETDGRGFDRVRADARAAWNSLFARSTAEGDETQLKNWYTSLYHLYFQPNDFADVGAEPRFTTLSLWDTFRAAQPWYTIAAPEIVVPEIKSMLGLYGKFGNLPRMSYGGGYIDCMIGEHILPVIADAYAKGFRGFDERLALEAMVKTVTEPHKGRSKENWEIYEKYGYLPFDLVRHESCSRTLEQCFDDWCLAKYAEALGEKEIAEKFRMRADNWKNIFDTSIGFARGKDSKGKWLEPFDPYAFGHETTVVGCFTEGNSFQYSWHVLHDLDGLMSAMGGRERMERNLDGLFTAQDKEGFRSCDITGLIGQYVHGNEPSHHVIYFYPQIGRPDKAAERIRDVFDRFYFPGPEGLSGNDDCGQMSAWYVFSAMGFYPFNPCGGEYVIGAPQVPKATLNLPNGKVFEMTAKNLSKENKYVKAVTLNGKPLKGWKLRHDDIVAGGALVFEMGPKIKR